MSFTCPRCGMTSHHPEDERHGYCSNCHDWTGGKQRDILDAIEEQEAAYEASGEGRLVPQAWIDEQRRNRRCVRTSRQPGAAAVSVTAVFHDGPLDGCLREINAAPFEIRVAGHPDIYSPAPPDDSYVTLPMHAYRRGKPPAGADQDRYPYHYFYTGTR